MRFEGSHLGVKPDDKLECGICWWVYDPAQGDDVRGIPPGTPIFDAFFSTKSHGTGLGLSITHRIVTDHGGTIDVDSAPGHTVFRVVLPLEGPQAGETHFYGATNDA